VSWVEVRNQTMSVRLNPTYRAICSIRQATVAARWSAVLSKRKNFARSMQYQFLTNSFAISSSCSSSKLLSL